MNSNIYEEKYKIISSDVDSHGIAKISSMIDLLHKAADRSLIGTGLDKESLILQGILWVIAEQNVEIIKLPILNENITIKTWVNEEFFNFIPRFYEISNDNEVLLRASSVWAVIDKTSRDTLTPNKCGITIPAVKTNTELPTLERLQRIEIQSTYEATVSKKHLDFNNHLNNAQYIGIIDSCNPLVENDGKKIPRKIIARYSSEAFESDHLIIKEGVNESSKYYSVDSERGHHLKLRIEY